MREHALSSWVCEKCGYRNDEDAVSCGLCEHPNPQTESYADMMFEEYETDAGILINSSR